MRELKFRAWDIEKKEWINHVMIGLDGVLLVNEAMVYEGKYELNQYTGLKDKNGKDVYEHDIIKFLVSRNSNLNPDIVIVEWGDFGWYLSTPYWLEDTITDGYFEILGNVYQNPELVEELNN